MKFHSLEKMAVHSSQLPKWEKKQVVVNEKPHRHGGFPHIEADGYILPVTLKNGPLILPIGTPVHELHSCEMVVLTFEEPWDLNSIHDQDISTETYNNFCSEYFDEDNQMKPNLK